MPEPDRSEYIARLRAWGEADDGQPVYLANIMHFNDPIQPWPGVNILPASAEATNKVYLEVAKTNDSRQVKPNILANHIARARDEAGDS